jgi:hypothetical protein
MDGLAAASWFLGPEVGLPVNIVYGAMDGIGATNEVSKAIDERVQEIVR